MIIKEKFCNAFFNVYMLLLLFLKVELSCKDVFETTTYSLEHGYSVGSSPIRKWNMVVILNKRSNDVRFILINPDQQHIDIEVGYICNCSAQHNIINHQHMHLFIHNNNSTNSISTLLYSDNRNVFLYHHLSSFVSAISLLNIF